MSLSYYVPLNKYIDVLLISLQSDLTVQLFFFFFTIYFLDFGTEAFQHVYCRKSYTFLIILDAFTSRRPKYKRDQLESHGNQHIPNPVEMNQAFRFGLGSSCLLRPSRFDVQ